MSEGQAEEGGDRLRELIEALLGGRRPEQPPEKGVLTGVDIRRLLDYVFSDYPEARAEEEVARLKRIVDQVSEITRMLLNAYLSDGVSRIVHPRYGMSVVRARFSEIVVIMRRMVEESWAEVGRLIDAGATPEEVERAAERAQTITNYMFIVATELYARLLTVLHINAPPQARPPLVNTALGYDIIK